MAACKGVLLDTARFDGEDCLAQVALGRSCDAAVQNRVRDQTVLLDDLLDGCHYFLDGGTGDADNEAPAPDWASYFGQRVADEDEAQVARVLFHCAPQGVLCL